MNALMAAVRRYGHPSASSVPLALIAYHLLPLRCCLSLLLSCPSHVICGSLRSKKRTRHFADHPQTYSIQQHSIMQALRKSSLQVRHLYHHHIMLTISAAHSQLHEWRIKLSATDHFAQRRSRTLLASSDPSIQSLTTNTMLSSSEQAAQVFAQHSGMSLLATPA